MLFYLSQCHSQYATEFWSQTDFCSNSTFRRALWYLTSDEIVQSLSLPILKVGSMMITILQLLWDLTGVLDVKSRYRPHRSGLVLFIKAVTRPSEQSRVKNKVKSFCTQRLLELNQLQQTFLEVRSLPSLLLLTPSTGTKNTGTGLEGPAQSTPASRNGNQMFWC